MMQRLRIDHHPTPWKQFGNCFDNPAAHELMFPAPVGISRTKGSYYKQQSAPAKRLCDGCAVRDDCRDYALDTRQSDGIWGGMTPEERRLYHKYARSIA